MNALIFTAVTFGQGGFEDYIVPIQIAPVTLLGIAVVMNLRNSVY
jgi:hypothetical protein